MSAAVKTNIWNIRVGDKITFTNTAGSKRTCTVTRVEDRSWYDNGSRKSYGTLNDLSKYPDFEIIRV